MAEPYITEDMDRALEEGGIPATPQLANPEYVPAYRMVGESKIPVSKKYGPLWKARRDAAAKKRDQPERLWDEVNKYYENEQSGHRTEVSGDEPVGTGPGPAQSTSPRWSETENIIYAHNASMVPALYGQAPAVEFTAEERDSEDEKAFAVAYERLCNILINMKVSPGINLHPKVRRAVLSAQLTNYAIAEIEWISRDASTDGLAEHLQDLSTKLAEAKEIKDIEKIEGQLIALEETSDALNPPGPVVRLIGLKDFFIDPESMEPDLSDAQWVMKRTFLRTSYVKAVFAQEYEGDDECRSLYEPTHVLQLGQLGDNTQDDPALGWSLFPKDGSNTDTVPDREQYTEVYYVWDRTSQRVFLYHAQQWTWPLWVWDNPTKLDRFFPFYRLWFSETLSGNYAHGEAAYTLDQQDALNGINSEKKRWREWAVGNWLYNSNKMHEDDAKAVLRGPNRDPRGVALDEGMDFESIVHAVLPPSAEYAALFDPGPIYQSFDRITASSPALRGQEFRTNTTNEAVETYNASTATRLGEKVDAIENWIADIIWGVVQLINLNMDTAMVSDLIGPQLAAAWHRVSPRDLRTKYAMRVVAGSTQKPNSEMKKREAIQVGQVLGQFGANNPVVASAVVKMFASAFDSVVISDADLAKISASVEPQQPGAAPGQADPRAQLEQALAQMPPEQKAQLQALLDQGVPAEQALQQLGITLQ